MCECMCLCIVEVGKVEWEIGAQEEKGRVDLKEKPQLVAKTWYIEDMVEIFADRMNEFSDCGLNNEIFFGYWRIK